MAKTSTQRVSALRKRRKAAGLAEVRGIWAPARLHREIRACGAAVVLDDQLPLPLRGGALERF